MFRRLGFFYTRTRFQSSTTLANGGMPVCCSGEPILTTFLPAVAVTERPRHAQFPVCPKAVPVNAICKRRVKHGPTSGEACWQAACQTPCVTLALLGKSRDVCCMRGRRKLGPRAPVFLRFISDSFAHLLPHTPSPVGRLLLLRISFNFLLVICGSNRYFFFFLLVTRL